MGLMDIMRATVGPAAAARGGFLAGQEKEEDQQRALARQSRLDRLKQAVDEAQVNRNNAQAKYYGNRSTGDSTVHTIDTADDGIMRWDATQKKFVPTGHTSAASARAARTEGREQRAEARAKRQDTKEDLSGVERQIGDKRNEERDTMASPLLSNEESDSRLGRIRASIDSLGGVRDSINNVMKGGKPAKKRTTSTTPSGNVFTAGAENPLARVMGSADLPPLTPQQKARAASDPEYSAFLKSKGY